jgi:adenylosuccinate lyase
MSAHDNYQTPLASRYASSGECPAIPAPCCLILDRLLLALVKGEVLTLVMCTEMRELFSARKRGSTWRQLWLWSVLESLHSLGIVS